MSEPTVDIPAVQAHARQQDAPDRLTPMDPAVRRLALRFNTVACLAVLSAIFSYCFAEENAQVLAFVSLVGCAIGWRLGCGRRDASGHFTARPIAMPKFLVNLLVLISLLHAAFNVFGGGLGEVRFGTPIVSILAQFLVYIQLVKLFDRANPRDDGHVLGLSVFVVIGAILTSNQLIVGVLLIVYTPLVIAAAMMLQLIAGHRMAHESVSNPAALNSRDTTALPAAFPAGRGSSRDFRRAGIAAFLIIVSMATAAFVFTPRGLGENILGTFGRVGSGSRIGFTDSIQLGRSGRLGSDSTPVMDVRVFDSQDQNIGAQLGTLYMRGAVNNHYNRQSKSWEFRPAPDFGLLDINSLTPDTPTPFGLQRGATGVIQQSITFRRGGLRDSYLFTMWRPLAIQNVSRPLRIDPPGQERVIRVRDDEDPRLLTYTVRSALEYTDPTDVPRGNVRFQNERIRALALQLAERRGITGVPTEWPPDAIRRAISAFQDHLRSTCTYTLNQFPPDDNEDPIEMFLFRTQQGHCEYFASALVAMCQSIGIDARIVAGYLAAQFDPSEGAFRVLESNAHAWAEVRLAPGRWQQFDPSPPDEVNREHRGTSGFFARLRRFYDAINFSWSSTVISFDRSKQAGLIGTGTAARANNWSDRLRALNLLQRLRAASPGRLLGIALLATSVVLIAWTLRRFARPVVVRLLSLRSRRASRVPLDPHLRQLLEHAGFYTRMLAALRGAGLEKPTATPPLTHAAHVALAHSTAGQDTELLSRLYYQIRFGRRPLAPEQSAAAHAALVRIEQTLRRTKKPNP